MEERKVISLLAPGVDEEEMAKKADLVDGKVPASELPSYVDDVAEYENVEAFPEDGEQGKIYVALDSGFTYRWSGSEYIQIGGQDLSDYYTKEEADQLLDTKQPVGDYATNTALEEGLATKQPVGDYATNTALAEGLADKQDVGDYATNTALEEGLATKQPVGDYATNTVLTEGLATKQPVGDYATNTALTEGLATKQPVGDYATSAELIAGLETKQDTIADLDTIRSGAAAGATAVQPAALNDIVAFDGILTLTNQGYNFTSDSCDIINQIPYRVRKLFKLQTTEQSSNPEMAFIEVYVGAISSSKCNLHVYRVVNAPNTVCGVWGISQQAINVSLPITSTTWISWTNGEAPIGPYNSNNYQWDKTPTSGSTRPVTSGGIYTALAAKQDAGDYATNAALTEGLATKQDVGDYATSADLEALEQAVATDMEVVPYQNQTPLTAEQLAKAERGELAILNNNLVHTKFTQDGNVVSFQALEHMAAVGTYTPGYNVRMRRYTITLDRATRMLNDGAGYQQGISISDTDANFLASGETPAADGKRVIREMNMPGTLSDAELELAWTMPNKGDIIRFDAFGDGTQKRFRVVKLEDAVATIMSMDDDITSLYNDTYTTTTFDDTYTGLQYANSLIDVACNTTYYNQLSSETKAAIITTNRVQDYWNGSASGSDTIFRIDSRDSFTRFGQPHAHTIIGDRYCFVLGMDDLVEYFNIQQGDRVSGLDFVEFYTEQTAIKYDTYFRLSTVYYGKSVYSLTVYDAIIHNYNYDLLPTSIVRPAFRIDLSKIQFTRE